MARRRSSENAAPRRRRRRRVGSPFIGPFTVFLVLLTVHCGRTGHGSTPASSSSVPEFGCRTLDAATCRVARGLLLAAEAFGAVGHPFVLDPGGARATGAGFGPPGAPAEAPPCAHLEAGNDLAPPVAGGAPDVAFAGVSIGGVLYAIDDQAPEGVFAASPPPSLDLVAFALLRPKAPDFLAPEPAVRARTLYANGNASPRVACACGTATAVVGALRDGALTGLSLGSPAQTRGRFRDLVRASLESPGKPPVPIAFGALSIDGLASLLDGGAARPLALRPTAVVPLARAVYPLTDFCPEALPAPEVGPTPLDFGDAPYGTEASRTVQITNRAPYAIDAIVGARTVAVPARTRTSIPLTWTPAGEALATELQTREETWLFVPHGASAAPPAQNQIAHLAEVVRTGPPRLVRREALAATAPSSSGVEARVDATWTCPIDYEAVRCETAAPRCDDPTGRCASPGAQVLAERTATKTGCHFHCRVMPSARSPAAACEFQAGMECRLQFSPR